MKEQEIFIEALQRDDGPSRAAYLDEACGDDAPLRQTVEELLADAAVAGSYFLDHPVGVCATVDVSVVPDRVGTQIGPYKIREQIGEGGMGLVYVAEQTEPVRRKVALKLIKPGMSSKDVVARFEAERQALAMMDHPNIARVFDGGATDVGQPYFVMELVQGLPITEYCDQQQLGARERLGLFLIVCRAVHHAHQKGVIHRDLKPSNVLVPEIDGAAVPKVIDFGVAKAVSQKLSEQTVYTQFAQLVGTPLYMSPEQAGLGVVDVDTRSDVYSLGVLLYELLTGRTPFDSETLKQAGFDEMRRMIREDERPRPSAMVSTLEAQALSTVAERRGSDPRKLSESLQGELDWLVMKAMEKDRNRRYESASALAADVERYLKNEPIAAGPPSAVYRIKKFAQRNKSRLIAASLTAVVLLAGLTIAVGATLQNRRQLREVTQDVERSVAEARTAIETGDLTVGRQRLGEAKGRISNARNELQQLAASVDKLDEELGERRKLLKRLAHFEELARQAMDNMSFDQHFGGDAQAREAFQTFGVLEDDRWFDRLQKSYLSEEQQHRVRQTAYETLLVLADFGVRWDGSESSAKKSLELLRKAKAFHDPTRAFYWVRSECHELLNNDEQANQDREQFKATLATLAFDYYLPGHTAGWRGDLDEAIRSYEAALRIQPDHFNSLFYLGMRLDAIGKKDEAAQVYRACLALRPDHVVSLRHRARQLAFQRRFAEALELINKAIQLAPDARQYQIRGEILHRKGDLHKALADLAKALEVADSATDRQSIGSVHFIRGLVLKDLGRLDETIVEMTKAIQFGGNFYPAGAYGTRMEAYYAKREYEKALADVDKAIEILSGTSESRQDFLRPINHFNRGILHICLNNYEQALADLSKAIELDPEYVSAYANAAWLRADCPDPTYRNSAEALQFAMKAVEIAPDDANNLDNLGRAQYLNGDFSGTINSCTRALEIGHDDGGISPLFLLAMAHWQLDERDAARKWYEKAVQKIANEKRPDEQPAPLKAIDVDILNRLRNEAEQLLGITEKSADADDDAGADDSDEPDETAEPVSEAPPIPERPEEP